MYLEHFGFSQYPFHLTPNTGLFLGLEPHYEAIQMVTAALQMGEGVIKVTGEVGSGKTMVCRMLINHLQDNVQLVYLPNPVLNGDELRLSVANELGLEVKSSISIVDEIQEKLVELSKSGKQTIVIVDEAQALSDEALEVLRLFGNLETEQSKLLNIVLIGQPELDERLSQHHLRQFRQRITFNARLRALSLDESVAYINTRLARSGGSDSIFSLALKKSIWKASSGNPRLINQICHKALILAFGTTAASVSRHQLYSAIYDTVDSCKPKFKAPFLWGWSHS
ncbi:AAA family ATPase [Vibrio sp. 10N.261.55.A7]|uniref:ExeA family protein n=1 Tax=Vibrio sp. 10N.261.55.A7 TaxID=1880851 RepID=UPI000C8151A1|nr:AAA family ATPase [Vibrio sp. 10N.261.55.A7]PMJ91345.1 MSHA biogenesis protein MshM [Vibrio sp. 10N.261.55.A7]